MFLAHTTTWLKIITLPNGSSIVIHLYTYSTTDLMQPTYACYQIMDIVLLSLLWCDAHRLRAARIAANTCWPARLVGLPRLDRISRAAHSLVVASIPVETLGFSYLQTAWVWELHITARIAQANADHARRVGKGDALDLIAGWLTLIKPHRNP